MRGKLNKENSHSFSKNVLLGRILCISNNFFLYNFYKNNQISFIYKQPKKKKVSFIKIICTPSIDD